MNVKSKLFLVKEDYKLKISTDDLILMRLEKMCKDFLFTVIKKFALSIKLKTLKIEDINQQRVTYLQ